MQLIGIRVFSEGNSSTRKKRAKSANTRQLSIQTSKGIDKAPDPIQQNNSITTIPDLPDFNLKIGAFVYEAMKKLADSGYSFAEEEIDEMCTPSWAKKTFHTSHPFMKRYYVGADNKGTDGYVRFKKGPYLFGNTQVLISKEWFENQRDLFITWYISLANQTSAGVTLSHPTAEKNKSGLPELPDRSLKAGRFVRETMKALSDSGYVFPDQVMRALCEECSMKNTIGMQRNLPFFKLFDPADEKGYMIDGRPRYYSEPLTFGKYKVYICSQIYENDKSPFIKWYEQLMQEEK